MLSDNSADRSRFRPARREESCRRVPPKFSTIRKNTVKLIEILTALIRQKMRPEFGSGHLTTSKSGQTSATPLVPQRLLTLTEQ
jgi:hypothetical protein